jgi:hypothetical protein
MPRESEEVLITEQQYDEVKQLARQLIETVSQAHPAVALTALCEALACVGAQRQDIDEDAIDGFVEIVEQGLRESFATIADRVYSD